MDWKEWNNKEVFVQLRTGAVYSGRIVDVDLDSPPLIFLTIIDKYGKRIVIVHSEITKLIEEKIRK